MLTTNWQQFVCLSIWNHSFLRCKQCTKFFVCNESTTDQQILDKRNFTCYMIRTMLVCKRAHDNNSLHDWCFFIQKKVLTYLNALYQLQFILLDVPQITFTWTCCCIRQSTTILNFKNICLRSMQTMLEWILIHFAVPEYSKTNC